MPKSHSNENITNERIWLEYINFCTTAATIVAGGDADNVTEELMVEILENYDGVKAVSDYLDVEEDAVREIVSAMMHPQWSTLYENLVFPLERAHEGAKEGGSPKISKERPAYIYLMYDNSTGYYKIGKSVNPEQRLNSINRSHAPGNGTVELVHVFLASPVDDAEKAVHKAYESMRVEREWFALEREQVDAIANILEYKDGTFFVISIESEVDEENEL